MHTKQNIAVLIRLIQLFRELWSQSILHWLRLFAKTEMPIISENYWAEFPQ